MENNAPIRISVIMGIYNCGPTLAEALDSLLAQTYQGFKVIMCDDGSKDNTREVAQSYVEKYPGKFILLTNKHNLKLAATLNRCLEYADTEYVARMDGDDLSLPDRFASEIEFLDSHPEYALVSCPMVYFDESGDYHTGHSESEPTKEAFRFGTPFCHAPVLMRRNILNAIGNYTAEPWIGRSEDYYLWYKFYKAGHRGFNLSTPLYKMRNDRNAIARRTVKFRWMSYKVGVKVMSDLGLKHPHLSGLPGLAKAIVPGRIVELIYKIKYRH